MGNRCEGARRRLPLAGCVIALIGCGGGRPLPGTVANVIATALPGAGVQLSWSRVLGAQEYRVERSTDGDPGPALVIGTPSEPALLDAGALPGRFHSYLVRARNAAGLGQPSLLVRLGVPTAAPSGTASALASSVQLSWPPIVGATGYRVLRARAGEAVEIGRTDATSLSDFTAPPGLLFDYLIVSLSPVGEGGVSTAVRAGRPLGAPTYLTADVVGGQVLLLWAPVVGAQAYAVLRAAGGGAPWVEVVQSAERRVSLPIAPGDSALFSVVAISEVNTSPASPAAPARRAALAPQALTAVVDEARRVHLSWTGALGAAGYKVWRAPAAGQNFVLVAAPADPNLLDVGATPGTAPVYWVQSTSPGGDSVGSTPLETVVLPDVPRGVVARADPVASSATITWSGARGASLFTLLRRIGASETAIGPLIQRDYQDRDLPGGTRVRYAVRALSDVGHADSAEVEILTIPAQPEGLSAQPHAYSVDLRWSDVPSAQSYEIEREYNWVVGTSTIAAFTDGNGGLPVSPDRGYAYAVRAVNATGRGPPARVVVRTLLPSTPFAAEGSDTAIVVWWTPVPNAVRYRVTRSEGGPFLPLAEAAGTSFVDRERIVPGQTYFYQVQAVNGSGTAGESVVHGAIARGVEVLWNATFVTDLGEVRSFARSLAPWVAVGPPNSEAISWQSHIVGSDGTIAIPGIPAGQPYKLRFHVNGDTTPFSEILTSQRFVDLSYRLRGREDVAVLPGAISLTVDGLTPWTAEDSLVLFGLGAGNLTPRLDALLDAAPAVGSSTAVGLATRNALYANGAPHAFSDLGGDGLTLFQLHAQTSSTNQPYRAVTRALTLQRFASRGDPTNVAGSLTDAPPATLSIQHGGSAFRALQPLLNPLGVDGGDRISLLSRHWAPALWPQEPWDANDPALLVVDLPSGTGDTDLGRMTYGDPFSRAHTLTVSSEVRVPMSLPGVATPAWVIAGVRVEGDPATLALSMLQPTQGPVLRPRINGVDAFSGSLTFSPAAALPVTLSWDPPTLGIPTDYIVEWFELKPSQGQLIQQSLRRFLTRETSVGMPLQWSSGGYYATITAQQREGDLQRAPLSIPHRRASSTVVTALLMPK